MGVRLSVLLDTHALIWLAESPARLSASAKQAITPRSTKVFVSIASLWEMAIKVSRGKLELDLSLQTLIDEELATNGIEILPILSSHVIAVRDLAYPSDGHADPFDRILVAQALVENLDLVSADTKLDGYGIQRIW